jgi:glucose/arabinose dehydrogenase
MAPGRSVATSWFIAAVVAALMLPAGGCLHRILPSEGGGEEARFTPPRRTDPQAVAVPSGYRIEVVATGLTFPSGIAFDEQSRPYVVEAGYAYGEVVLVPGILRINADGSTTEIARGDNPPWNGIEYRDGAFFVAGGELSPGRILRIGMDGRITVIVDGLPSTGDHHPNGPVFGPDGKLYWGEGTATNSGVVGIDNFDFGWLKRYPQFHDVPCRDVTLAGRNYTTSNPLTEAPDDRATTGAFVPFGTPTSAGQVVRGQLPCNGAILRVSPTGGAPELVAWGLRNPFGLAWSPDGALYVTENQYDDRGSRPVFGAGDLLWRIQPGSWYGWPDYFGSRPLTREDWFRPPGGPSPGFVLQSHPNTPPPPVVQFGVHAAATGIDFSRSAAFGYPGEAFVAEFGDMAPAVGKTLNPVGFKVVRVDVANGTIQDFAVNRGGTNGPASLLEHGGLERPVAVRFSPDGQALYVVDFGVMTMEEKRPVPHPGTGVVWRITRTGAGR